MEHQDGIVIADEEQMRFLEREIKNRNAALAGTVPSPGIRAPCRSIGVRLD